MLLTSDLLVPVNKLIAFDPGGTTGIAVFTRIPGTKRFAITDVGESPNWRDIPRLLNRRGKVIVVYENFYNLTLSANLVPVKVIGVIEYLCKLNKIPHFLQPPAERKVAEELCPEIVSFFPDHIKSAVSHGIVFLVKKKVCHFNAISLGENFNQGKKLYRYVKSLDCEG